MRAASTVRATAATGSPGPSVGPGKGRPHRKGHRRCRGARGGGGGTRGKQGERGEREKDRLGGDVNLGENRSVEDKATKY